MECATLAVPLDHSAPAGPSIELALARRPAAGETRGAILMNPGGPGASGLYLAEYAGEYWSEELLTGYRLEVHRAALVAHHQRHPPIHLDPVARDEFGGDTWFFGGVEFDRNEAGEITGMRVSNGRVRNLVFERR